MVRSPGGKPGADVNFDDVAGLQTIVDKWTSHYAATSEMHDAAAFAKIPADKQVSARGIEVGHIFYSDIPISNTAAIL